MRSPKISSCRSRTTRSFTAKDRCSAKCPATTGRSSPTCGCCTASCSATPERNCSSWAMNSASGREWNHDASLDWHLAPRSAACGPQALGARSEHFVPWRSRRFSKWISIQRVSNGWTARTISAASSLSCGAGVRPTTCCFSYAISRRWCEAIIEWAYLWEQLWKEILNSDAPLYGGSGQGNFGAVQAAPLPIQGRPFSLTADTCRPWPWSSSSPSIAPHGEGPMAKQRGSATDPLWYQGCAHLRTARSRVQGQQRRWHRRFSRPDPETRLSPGPRASPASGCCPFFLRRSRTTATTFPIISSVHPMYGTIEDFQAFLDAAHDRGLQVMIELVVNHTSDQHPWFQAARQAPPRIAGARFLRLERHRREIRRRPHHLHRHRKIELDLGSCGQSLLLAPFLLPSAGPELRQSPGDGRNSEA